MVKRSMGKMKLTPQVRQRLAEMTDEARNLVYGEAGCPSWGTLFADIEDDAKEVGHEFIRTLELPISNFPQGKLKLKKGISKVTV